MATRRKNMVQAYGIGEDLIRLAPRPIKSKRNPSNKDFAPIGTPWINELQKSTYILSSSSNNTANWNSAGGIGASVVQAQADGNTVTLNAKSFKAVFTGFTTASPGSQEFVINNNKHLSNREPVVITASNNGNQDAQMTVTRVDQSTVGQLTITLTNNGGAALNGDVIITGEIKS